MGFASSASRALRAGGPTRSDACGANAPHPSNTLSASESSVHPKRSRASGFGPYGLPSPNAEARATLNEQWLAQGDRR
jgi:hypothetical protein